MKKNIFISNLLLISSIIFTACGGGGGGSEEVPNTQRNIQAGESITCSDETTFSITPSQNVPDVTITSDVESGNVTIAVDSTSQGSVLVSSCTEIK